MLEKQHVDFAQFMEGVIRRNPGELEFHQAVHDVASDIFEYIDDKPAYHEAQILRRLAEPDRVISFRVCWQDDQGKVRVQRGYRVQNNNAIGPYKGGLRFHKSVNQSILKFLAFEQTFKNSLTGLPMGGGKGGSDFNPKGKSDNEIMRFCQSFMTELYRHVGEVTDVPAGDIGVGAKEIGYMFGQYKRITNRYVGVLTGKGLSWGGSLVRTEATGYGLIYFVENMLAQRTDSISNKTICVSGAGNVALHAAEKAITLGAKVITLSDSSGFVHDPSGLTQSKIDWLKQVKTDKQVSIAQYTEQFSEASFHQSEKPWHIPCDIALPCATQNEITQDDAIALINNGVEVVAEGANMPCDTEAVRLFRESKIAFGPAKAANAGGVAVSGLEMSQNSARMSWDEARLHDLLRDIMRSIHDRCRDYGQQQGGYIDYAKGANIAGFKKVAEAMLAFGIV
ncbi:NAD(P)-specific glutamate dehydrogenase [Zhongshania aliphaticivorans]|uniref:Glutamate dehydrogenase n=1 Tax=Zhongshania aliphaticivorans TaxID=1470434 RepID=A0A5S9MTE4_9GAMM|nr:NADP-specific glutamate dehydrogenase [Zhongshania aliphaticivorans]CAA0079255.1 NAD(P)-specific glutamate dehydrogenase [Zhongshania aliphaticivorans]CAA0086234.1 NAD(P)-specific glutamate dehydrogenase [Zhongshania aliphaticivorans]